MSEFKIIDNGAGIYAHASLKGYESAEKAAFAMDAQPVAITQANAGVPHWLATYVEPKLVEVLVSPMKAAEAVGDEGRKGDFKTKNAQFTMIEGDGNVHSYGDYDNGGMATANVNYIYRDSFLYSSHCKWGDLEADMYGLARIDWVNRLRESRILTLNKFQNRSYLFGISGLKNYGILNDPALLPSLTPAIGGSGSRLWANKSSQEKLYDIHTLFEQLVTRADGLVDAETKMNLIMPPTSQAMLVRTSEYNNISIFDQLNKNYPNMEIVTVPEYALTAGNLVQLIAVNIAGQQTASCAFNVKLMMHRLIPGSSSFSQKMTQGTFGTIVYRPFLISSMLGV